MGSGPGGEIGLQPRFDPGRAPGADAFPTGETLRPSKEMQLARPHNPPPSSLVSISLSGDDPLNSSTEGHALDLNSRHIGKQASHGSMLSSNLECEEESVAKEVVMDPSKWILLNQETGQELDAQAFVEAIMLLAAPHDNPFSSNFKSREQQAPLSGSWGVRRQRSAGHIVRRPSLLPSCASARNDSSAQTCWQSLPPDLGSQPTPQSLLQPVASSSKSPQGRGSIFPGVRGAQPASAPPSLPARPSSHLAASVNSSESGFSLSKLRPAQVLRELHAGGIRSMCFSPSGDLLATAGADNNALVFRVRRRRDGTGGGLGFRNSGGGLTSLLGNTQENGKQGTMAGVQAEWAVRVLEETPIRVLSGHVGEVVALSWAPDDGALLTASADGTVRCWRPHEGQDCTAVYEHGGRVTSVAWDPASPSTARGGGRFLTGCMDGKLRIFSVDAAEEEASVLAERPVTAVQFAPSGAGFVAGFVGGGVGFYRTEGMVQELTAECRRHGLRHQARHATSPVRRLSVGSGRGSGKRNNGNNGEARRYSSASNAPSRNSRSAEGRVTGISFRPRPEGASRRRASGSSADSPRANGDARLDSGLLEAEHSADEMHMSVSTDSVPEERILDEYEAVNGNAASSERAPVSSVLNAGRGAAPRMNGDANETGGGVWTGCKTDVLVSTNDSRVRVVDPGRAGGAVVRRKLKGHNTEGVLGRHAVASYSQDGEFVVSGSGDGFVHAWPASAKGPSAAPKRGVGWSNSREGHERVLVCAGKVAVPVAIFAPESVARGIGGDSTRIIVAGDAEGTVKVFIG